MFFQTAYTGTCLYRINLFYDNSNCISLDCAETEDDAGEICFRLHSIAPKLSLSHEVLRCACIYIYNIEAIAVVLTSSWIYMVDYILQ